MKTHDMTVSGWWGGTWGLSVPSEHMGLFEKYRTRLTNDGLLVHLPDVCQPLKLPLTPSFWRTCPEVRSVEIGRWMCGRGEAPWPMRQPPRYRATLIIGPKIELKLRC